MANWFAIYRIMLPTCLWFEWGVTSKIFSAWVCILSGAALLGAGVYALLATFN